MTVKMRFILLHLSKELTDLNPYNKFGIADTSIFELCKNGIFGITTDFPLYDYLINHSF